MIRWLRQLERDLAAAIERRRTRREAAQTRRRAQRRGRTAAEAIHAPRARLGAPVAWVWHLADEAAPR
jgi:hypothetical protein